MKLHWEVVKKRSNKTGQTAGIRHRAQPGKCKDWPQFTYIGPFSVWTCFVPFPTPFPCLSLPQLAQSHWPAPTTWTLRSASLSVTESLFVCTFLTAHQLVWQTRFCFLSLSPLSLLGRFVSLSTSCLWLPPFPYNTIAWGLRSNNLTEINIPTFYLPSSVSDWSGLVLLSVSLMFLVQQICASECSYLFLLFLLSPHGTEKFLDQTQLTWADALSFHVPLQITELFH